MVKQKRSFAILIFFVIPSLDAALAFARYRIGASLEAVGLGAGSFVLALIVSSAIQVDDQWDRVAPDLARYQSAISWTSPMDRREGSARLLSPKRWLPPHSSVELYWNKY